MMIGGDLKAFQELIRGNDHCLPLLVGEMMNLAFQGSALPKEPGRIGA